MKAARLKAVFVAVAMALGERAHRGITSHMQRSGLMLSALAPVVDTIDAVPEGQRAWYAEKDGKFHLDLAKVDFEDTGGLKSALEKERKAARDAEKARKDLEKRFEGIDPEAVKQMMQRLEGDEEGRLLKEGKVDELVAKRSEKLRKELEKQVQTAAEKAASADQRAQKFSQRVLDNHIRAAATKAGIHAHAVEDALFRARTMFALNEEGEAVQMAGDGSVVLGKDGKTPFSPIEWMEGMKETAPHWFPAGGSGGGASGDKGGGSGAKTMKRTAFDALEHTARMEFIKSKGVVVD